MRLLRGHLLLLLRNLLGQHLIHWLLCLCPLSLLLHLVLNLLQSLLLMLHLLGRHILLLQILLPLLGSHGLFLLPRMLRCHLVHWLLLFRRQLFRRHLLLLLLLGSHLLLLLYFLRRCLSFLLLLYFRRRRLLLLVLLNLLILSMLHMLQRYWLLLRIHRMPPFILPLNLLLICLWNIPSGLLQLLRQHFFCWLLELLLLNLL
mmetsp:Transcript_21639/g.44418  ORF Transcript_21639/g.44418 Transcript_21639/m.44418 type:complete len:203 (+) Transcript_21639:441-1049(+)